MQIKHGKVDESWKDAKWMIRIGKNTCYSNSFLGALYGILDMYFPDGSKAKRSAKK